MILTSLSSMSRESSLSTGENDLQWPHQYAKLTELSEPRYEVTAAGGGGLLLYQSETLLQGLLVGLFVVGVGWNDLAGKDVCHPLVEFVGSLVGDRLARHNLAVLMAADVSSFSPPPGQYSAYTKIAGLSAFFTLLSRQRSGDEVSAGVTRHQDHEGVWGCRNAAKLEARQVNLQLSRRIDIRGLTRVSGAVYCIHEVAIDCEALRKAGVPLSIVVEADTVAEHTQLLLIVVIGDAHHDHPPRPHAGTSERGSCEEEEDCCAERDLVLHSCHLQL